MKTTTLVLAQEHAHLARALDWLEILLVRARLEDELDALSISPLLFFFESVVDGLHQDKEEQVLFPVLRKRTTFESDPTFERLLDDHHEDRRKLDQMRVNLEGAAYGDSLSLDFFLVHAKGYLDLQRAHMTEENRWLLPLAERVLSEEDDRKLFAGFNEIERVRGVRFIPQARKALARLERRSRLLAG